MDGVVVSRESRIARSAKFFVYARAAKSFFGPVRRGIWKKTAVRPAEITTVELPLLFSAQSADASTERGGYRCSHGIEGGCIGNQGWELVALSPCGWCSAALVWCYCRLTRHSGLDFLDFLRCSVRLLVDALELFFELSQFVVGELFQVHELVAGAFQCPD